MPGGKCHSGRHDKGYLLPGRGTACYLLSALPYWVRAPGSWLPPGHPTSGSSPRLTLALGTRGSFSFTAVEPRTAEQRALQARWAGPGGTYGDRPFTKVTVLAAVTFVLKSLVTRSWERWWHPQRPEQPLRTPSKGREGGKLWTRWRRPSYMSSPPRRTNQCPTIA